MAELASREINRVDKRACLASTASRYFFFFSFSADRRTESTVEYYMLKIPLFIDVVNNINLSEPRS